MSIQVSTGKLQNDTSTSGLPKIFKPIIQIRKGSSTRCKHVQHDHRHVLQSQFQLRFSCVVAEAFSSARNHRQSQRAKAMPAMAAAPSMGIAVAMAKPLDVEALPLLPLAVEEL